MRTSTNEIDLMLGKILRRRRREVGMTQADLGRTAGISFQQIQKYERGMNRLSVSRLFQLSEKLGVQPCDLIAELQECEAERQKSIDLTLAR